MTAVVQPFDRAKNQEYNGLAQIFYQGIVEVNA